VVVDATYRGAGVGRALYAAVFDRARRDGVAHVACEYDIEPPNPASARFHAAHGFREVGTQVLGAGKRVSLQMARLGA
jgi:predicted GNAT superfamily acetyltransferase